MCCLMLKVCRCMSDMKTARGISIILMFVLLTNCFAFGPVLDPDRELKGFGFAQRRHKQMRPKDVLVVEYLKQIQDVSSPEKQLLPSMEGLQAQTFNNALVSMAFMIEGEKE